MRIRSKVISWYVGRRQRNEIARERYTERVQNLKTVPSKY